MHAESGFTVLDGISECPYVPGRVSRLPLEWFGRRIAPEKLDALWAAGYRRCGEFFYRPQCPACTACQGVRVPVDRFRPSVTQRRVWRRGVQRFTIQVTSPACDAQRLELFNRHRLVRGLADEPSSWEEYVSFLQDTACTTVEIDYYAQGRLAAVAITDIGKKAWSAVYCYFDPDESRWSPGVFSILTHVQLARQHGAEYVYLGLYAQEAVHLRYKAMFRPQERLFNGQWTSVD